jgi:hypothetical protein
MGNDRRNSVIDTQLRVHGLSGLRVADTSAMPEIPVATPMPQPLHWRKRPRISSAATRAEAGQQSSERRDMVLVNMLPEVRTFLAPHDHYIDGAAVLGMGNNRYDVRNLPRSEPGSTEGGHR